MIISGYSFVAAIGIFLSLLLLIAGRFYLQNRRRPKAAAWEDLISKLTWVDRDQIAEVALDLVDESGEPKGTPDAGCMDSSQMWELIGGLDGLTILEKNSDVLIDLAFYVQQWYPEAVAIAERLRVDARQLKWHVNRLRAAEKNGNLQVSFAFYAQRATVSYYLMTRRMLMLWEMGKFPNFPDLERAI
jgi:hypothetical protein